MDRFTVGDARIQRVEEMRARLPLAMFNAPELVAREAGWMVPQWADAEGLWDMVVQSWIIEVDDRVVVIDPCVGNGRNLPHFPLFDQLDTPFIDRFSATGIRPEDVTVIAGDTAGMNASTTPSPAIASLRLVMSAASAAWPW